jgi:hypothetical protein
MPAFVLFPNHNYLMIGEVSSESRIGDDLLALGIRSWIWVSGYFEFHG